MRLNSCNFIGRLGKDAQVREPGGTPVASFSLAVSAFKKDGDTLWLNCSLWGNRATSLEQYLTRGKPVYVSGELTQRTYQKDGQDRTSLELRVNEIQLLGSKDDAGGGGVDFKSKIRTTAPDPGEDPVDDQEIPF